MNTLSLDILWHVLRMDLHTVDVHYVSSIAADTEFQAANFPEIWDSELSDVVSSGGGRDGVGITGLKLIERKCAW